LFRFASSFLFPLCSSFIPQLSIDRLLLKSIVPSIVKNSKYCKIHPTLSFILFPLLNHDAWCPCASYQTTERC
jgi:hypothetical protein